MSESAAIWAPLFTKLGRFRLLAVDLPGHGPSDPIAFRRGQVREHARLLIDDILDALGLDQVPLIGHPLGGMFALWHVAAGSERISELVAIAEPAVALPGPRVRMPLSLLTVRGLGVAVLRSPSPPRAYRRLLAQGLGSADAAAGPDALVEALRLSARRPRNARAVASLMHAIDRFRRPRPGSVVTTAELAAITTPAIFILGSDDPYLSIDRARPSIAQIPGATLYEMPGGHAPLARRSPPRGRTDRNPLTLRRRLMAQVNVRERKSRRTGQPRVCTLPPSVAAGQLESSSPGTSSARSAFRTAILASTSAM